MFKAPEENRLQFGTFGTSEKDGCNGLFVFKINGILIKCIVSDQLDWEHVSVTLSTNRVRQLKRCPTWGEMCFVKDQFWDESDPVIQVHPASKDYINFHPFCLHLWKPVNHELVIPPSDLVGGL